MEQRSTKSSDFGSMAGEAKKHASGVADAVSGAASDVYGQARESAGDIADAANMAARQAMGSFEQSLRHVVEQQPYTAVAIALGVGWLLGRMHRPL